MLRRAKALYGFQEVLVVRANRDLVRQAEVFRHADEVDDELVGAVLARTSGVGDAYICSGQMHVLVMTVEDDPDATPGRLRPGDQVGAVLRLLLRAEDEVPAVPDLQRLAVPQVRRRQERLVEVRLQGVALVTQRGVLGLQPFDYSKAGSSLNK